MPLAALPLQLHDVLGFGTVIVGITIGLQSLVTLFTRPLAGTLCDRRGAKFSMLLGGATSIAASVIYLCSVFSPLGAYPALVLILLARVISGFAESLLMTGALTGAIAVVGVHNTGKVMVWVGIGMYTAIAAGGPIGIELMTHQGAVSGFATVSLGMLAFSLLATSGTIFIGIGCSAWRRTVAVFESGRTNRTVWRRPGAGDTRVRRHRCIRRARFSAPGLDRRGL